MKPVVAYPLLATIFLIFLVFSQKPPVGHKGLNRRLAHMRVAFDPLIEKIERRAEGGELGDRAIHHTIINDKIGQHSNPPSDDNSVEEFLTDGGRFNVTERLIYLFPLLDRRPKDGWVSHEELEHWIVGQAMDRMSYRTESEARAHDKDGDGGITLTEYLSHLSDENKDMNKSPGRVEWWKERFLHADLDGDGSLNYREYKDFMYPEDTSNPRVQQWLLRDKLREMDHDGDGRLNFQEFRHHAYELYKINLELENDYDEDPYYVPSAEEKFAELDGNKDRHLSEDELEPLMHHLFPGEIAYASYYTKHLIHQADDDKNGNLSLEEMLEHQFVFYGSLYEDSRMEEEDDDMHEELRRR